MITPNDLAKLTPAEQAAIFERIDLRETHEGLAARRRSRRFTVQPPRAAMLHIESTLGNRSCPVLMRNLSASGCAFVHVVFVYPKSKCRIELRTIDGERVLATGVVMRCTHVSGRLHESGVRFDQPIDVCGFVSEAACAPSSPSEDPRWAEGRQLLSRLRAAIEDADIAASAQAVSNLNAWTERLDRAV